MSADLIWPQLPDGSSWTEAGRTEYTLGFDGSETLAVFEPGTDGELELAEVQVSPGNWTPRPPGWEDCRVYWGSHGCDLERGHEGDCDCGCCTCGEHHPYPDWPDTNVICVATAPYYGPETRFYGEDVAARGLPEVDGG